MSARDVGARITVPNAYQNEVQGVGTSKVWPVVPDTLDRCMLWAIGPAGCAQLDLSAVIRLREQLGEVAAVMLARPE